MARAPLLQLSGISLTFGGNPVSAAAALAVLDVIRDEGLQENAAQVSAYIADRMTSLRHPL